MKLPLHANRRGRLLRRYKRFFADVLTPDGETLTVHCANPGSMRGLLRKGSAVRCSTSPNPKRKLAHTLEMIRVGRIWVGVNTQRGNAVAALALRGSVLPGLGGYAALRPEVRVGEHSRLDFMLLSHDGGFPDAYVEVKSVTMAEGKRALFPDSVTERGRRHAELLGKLASQGKRAALLFVVQRADCERVSTADDIDPAYGEALRAAVKDGVEVHAVRARVTPNGIRVEQALPVVL